MKSLVSRTGRAIVRFFLRHWASSLIVLFALIAGLTLYQMWRAGLVGALSFLPQLAICLAAIVVVAVAKHLTKGFGQRALSRCATAISARAAKGVVEEGLSQGQEALKDTIEGAKGALSDLGRHVKDDLDEFVGTSQPTAASVLVARAPRCPACRHFVRAGAKFCDACGAPLPRFCPRCGRPLREGARFCDACGAVAPGT